jgi:hypothetical protein
MSVFRGFFVMGLALELLTPTSNLENPSKQGTFTPWKPCPFGVKTVRVLGPDERIIRFRADHPVPVGTRRV